MGINDLIGEIHKYRKVLIYGAGGVAEDSLVLLKPYLKDVELGVAVTKPEGEAVLCGVRVTGLYEHIDKASSTFVIIAAMPRLVSSMRALLVEYDFTNYTDVYEIFDKIYADIWMNKIEENKILFSNFKGKGFGDSGKYIAQRLLTESKGEYDIVWAVSEDRYDFPEGIRTVVYGTYDYYRELGTARVWIDNRHKSRLTYKREGQYYIQTWHGGGPLKKIEHDGNGISQSYLDLCDYDSGIIDLMISPTKFNSGLYRTAFNYGGEILECGYPRNDLFFSDRDKTRSIVEDRLGIAADDVIVLYAPTFRDNSFGDLEELDLGEIRSYIEKRYGRNATVMVRLHPDVADQSITGDVINATSYEDTQELLAAADILITDYSSIMWDFSLQKKPVFLYQPDNDGYDEERGYYLPFEEMPYFVAKSTQEMCRLIETFDQADYAASVERFLKEYGSFDRGNAAETIRRRIETVCKTGENSR